MADLDDVVKELQRIGESLEYRELIALNEAVAAQPVLMDYTTFQQRREILQARLTSRRWDDS